MSRTLSRTIFLFNDLFTLFFCYCMVARYPFGCYFSIIYNQHFWVTSSPFVLVVRYSYSYLFSHAIDIYLRYITHSSVLRSFLHYPRSSLSFCSRPPLLCIVLYAFQVSLRVSRKGTYNDRVDIIHLYAKRSGFAVLVTCCPSLSIVNDVTSAITQQEMKINSSWICHAMQV